MADLTPAAFSHRESYKKHLAHLINVQQSKALNSIQRSFNKDCTGQLLRHNHEALMLRRKLKQLKKDKTYYKENNFASTDSDEEAAAGARSGRSAPTSRQSSLDVADVDKFLSELAKPLEEKRGARNPNAVMSDKWNDSLRKTAMLEEAILHLKHAHMLRDTSLLPTASKFNALINPDRPDSGSRRDKVKEKGSHDSLATTSAKNRRVSDPTKTSSGLDFMGGETPSHGGRAPRLGGMPKSYSLDGYGTVRSPSAERRMSEGSRKAASGELTKDTSGKDAHADSRAPNPGAKRTMVMTVEIPIRDIREPSPKRDETSPMQPGPDAGAQGVVGESKPRHGSDPGVRPRFPAEYQNPRRSSDPGKPSTSGGREERGGRGQRRISLGESVDIPHSILESQDDDNQDDSQPRTSADKRRKGPMTKSDFVPNRGGQASPRPSPLVPDEAVPRTGSRPMPSRLTPISRRNDSSPEEAKPRAQPPAPTENPSRTSVTPEDGRRSTMDGTEGRPSNARRLTLQLDIPRIGMSKEEISRTASIIMSTLAKQSSHTLTNMDEDVLAKYAELIQKALEDANPDMEEQAPVKPTPGIPGGPSAAAKRSQKRRIMQLEEMLSSLPSTAKRKSLEIPPQEVLACSYLRLSKNNIQDCEEGLRQQGKDPGVHVHMTQEEAVRYFDLKDKIEATTRQFISDLGGPDVRVSVNTVGADDREDELARLGSG